MDESQQTTDEQQTQEPEKQTNRTFTQSEVDKLVSESLKKEKEKYGDVESIKDELARLREEKKKSELEKLDETERLKVELEEIQRARDEAQREVSAYKQRQRLQDILSDSKYAKMPKAYKNMVQYSEDQEVMLKSADNALAEFERDFGTGVKETFGIPDQKVGDPTKAARTVIRGAGDMQAALKAQIMEKINSHNTRK